MNTWTEDKTITYNMYFDITASVNAGTGYSIHVQSTDGLQFINKVEVKNKSIGGEITHMYTFKAVRVGDEQIIVTIGQSWNEISNHYTIYNIHVVHPYVSRFIQ